MECLRYRGNPVLSTRRISPRRHHPVRSPRYARISFLQRFFRNSNDPFRKLPADHPVRFQVSNRDPNVPIEVFEFDSIPTWRTLWEKRRLYAVRIGEASAPSVSVLFPGIGGSMESNYPYIEEINRQTGSQIWGVLEPQFRDKQSKKWRAVKEFFRRGRKLRHRKALLKAMQEKFTPESSTKPSTFRLNLIAASFGTWYVAKITKYSPHYLQGISHVALISPAFGIAPYFMNGAWLPQRFHFLRPFLWLLFRILPHRVIQHSKTRIQALDIPITYFIPLADEIVNKDDSLSILAMKDRRFTAFLLEGTRHDPLTEKSPHREVIIQALMEIAKEQEHREVVKKGVLIVRGWFNGNAQDPLQS